MVQRVVGVLTVHSPDRMADRCTLLSSVTRECCTFLSRAWENNGFKIQSAVSTEYILLLQHYKVEDF